MEYNYCSINYSLISNQFLKEYNNNFLHINFRMTNNLSNNFSHRHGFTSETPFLYFLFLVIYS